MRSIAILLSVCVIILSSFGGMVKPMRSAEKDCCKKMAGMACHKSQHKKKSDGCDEPYCTMLFSCSTCGFLVKQRVLIEPARAIYLPKPVSLYKIGDPSAYHSENWKPPKAC